MSDNAMPDGSEKSHVARERIKQTLWDRVLNRQRYRRVELTEKEWQARQPPEPWQFKAYKTLNELLTQRLAAHYPTWNGQFGNRSSTDFWCSECSRRWPCADAKALMSYGDDGDVLDYKLELVKVERPLPAVAPR